MFYHSKDLSFQGQQMVKYAKSQNNHFSGPKNAKKHKTRPFWPFFHKYKNREGHFSPKRLDGIFFFSTTVFLPDRKDSGTVLGLLGNFFYGAL